MPDLPLDTLVIIGLVLASLIGRIFQKSKTLTRARQKPRQIKLPTPDQPSTKFSRKLLGSQKSWKNSKTKSLLPLVKQSKGSNPKSSIFPRPLRPSQFKQPFLCRKRKPTRFLHGALGEWQDANFLRRKYLFARHSY